MGLKKRIDRVDAALREADWKLFAVPFAFFFTMLAITDTDLGLEALFLKSFRAAAWLFITIGWLRVIYHIYLKTTSYFRKRREAKSV